MTSLMHADPITVCVENATIFDGHRVLPANSVAITDGVITDIGMDVTRPRGARIIDAQGGLLTPGFVDAHAHPTFAGLERLSLDLLHCESQEATLAAIRTALSAATSAQPTAEAPTNPHDQRQWLTGGGWNMAFFPGGNPEAATLDSIGAELGDQRPIALINRDHHSVWVNSTALAIAGIDSSTPAPPGGVIERDAHGNPTGTLHEAAMDLVLDRIPTPDAAHIRAGIIEGQRCLNEVGVTGVNDAIVGTYSGHPNLYEHYLKAAADNVLTAEVTASLWWPRDVDNIAAQVQELAQKQIAGDRFRATNVKFMLDGIVESRTAYMAQPYRCPCGGTGTSYFSREHLHAAFTALTQAGFDIHVHAIGDKATTTALDAFAQLSPYPGHDFRHHIAHIQVVDPADIERFTQLGVAVNMQALWACHDDQMVDLNFPALGPRRSEWQYPFGSLNRSGALLAMGSDWPVSSADPWQAIHVAVNRSHPTAADPAPLIPNEALDVLTTLRAYTRGSAHLCRTETAGQLKLGQPADLALASQNPFALPDTELHSIHNTLTVANGHLVFEQGIS